MNQNLSEHHPQIPQNPIELERLNNSSNPNHLPQLSNRQQGIQGQKPNLHQPRPNNSEQDAPKDPKDPQEPQEPSPSLSNPSNPQNPTLSQNSSNPSASKNSLIPQNDNFKSDFYKPVYEEQDKPRKAKGNAILGCFGRTRFYIKIAIVEMRKRCCFFCIGVLSIIICIITSMIAQGVIDKSPLIFYNTAAVANGELDLVISAVQSSQAGQNPTLNLTQVESQTLSIINTQPTGRYKMETLFSKNTVFDEANTKENVKATFVSINSQREINAGIVEDGLLTLKDNKVAISRTLATNLNLSVGSKFYMKVSNTILSERLKDQYKIQMQNNNLAPPFIDVSIEVIVDQILSNFLGRFPDTDLYQRVVLFESASFFQRVGDQLKEKYKAQPASSNYKFAEWVHGQKIEEHSEQVIINFENRLDIYLSGNYLDLLEKAVPAGARVIERLGYNSLDVSMPLVEAMAIARFANTFISITLNLIVIGLLYMASYVIFNLMLITVDTRIYETAVQRVLGLNKFNMIAMMATNGMLFTFFGLVIGLPLTAGLLAYINGALLSGLDAGFTIDYSVKNTFIAIAIAVGIPQFASITPIRNLLAQGIASSLDSDHSKTSSMKVNISNETKKFPINSFSAAVFSIFMGVSIYFMLPLALLTLDIGLFVIIFFGLLICLLLGSLLLAVNFNYTVEWFLMLFLFFEKKFMKKLIRMNLISHRLRNRRTVVIFSLGLAFINFIYVSFFMQIQSSQIGQLRRQGAEITVNSRTMTVQNWINIIKENELHKKIDYAYHLDPLHQIHEDQGYSQVTFGNHGQIVTLRNWCFTVSPNFSKVTKTDLGQIFEYKGNYGITPYELMYAREGNGGTVMGQSVYERMMLNSMDRNDTILMKYSNSTELVKKEIFPIAAYARGAVFIFSSRPGSGSNFILSIPNFMSLFNPTQKYSFFTQVLDKVFIKIKPEFMGERDNILKLIEQPSFREGYRVWNNESYKESFASTQGILNVMFIFITSISMGLSLFSLISTMASNIFEQVKELGVMRCIGLTRFQIARVFWYESIIVVMSGGLIGLFVGMCIGWTIIAQTALFSNGEVKLVFPVELFLTVMVFSVFSSVFAGGIPAFRFLRTGITKLVKGQ